MPDAKLKRIFATMIFLASMFGCALRIWADVGTLSVNVHEPNSQALLPCRAWVTVSGERFFKPVTGVPQTRKSAFGNPTESCTPYAKDRSFSCNGSFVIEVPPGKAVVHIERGKEYESVDNEVIVPDGQTAKVHITLRRWVNMANEGWYSADMHCHFGVNNLAALKQLALTDDINFEPILTLWNHQPSEISDKAWPDWPSGPTVFADPTHLVTLRNEEIERIGGASFESVGALLMFGLAKPVEMPSRNSKSPCDAVLGQIAKSTSPQCIIDTDKPIWGENVVGVALGLFDSVQVCHNHYHRESTLLPGWGMAGRDIEDKQVNWGQDELFHRTNLTYYRFLNCGFKLAVTGGSAMGVMPVPLGYNRTYAKLRGPLTEANYLEAIRAGRTFATSGPMLILTVDGLDSGAEIQYSSKRNKPLLVKGQLRSIQRIDSLELVFNGNVIKQVDLKDLIPSPSLKESVLLAFRPPRSGWIAARAIFRSPDGRLRQAHTSPVYITMDGKPTASRKDAEHMIRWIDRLLAISEKPGRYKSESERAEAQTIFHKARKVYENIVRTAAEAR